MEHDKIIAALGHIEHLPGLTGERILRKVGMNVKQPGGAPCKAGLAFLAELATVCQTIRMPKTPWIEAQFFAADYKAPQLHKPAISAIPEVKISYTTPTAVIAPKAVQMAKAIKQEKDERIQQPQSMFKVRVKAQSPEPAHRASKPRTPKEPRLQPALKPVSGIPPEVRSTRYDPRRLKTKAKIMAALEAMDGSPITMREFVKLAGIGYSAIYKAAYKDELLLIQDAVRKSNGGAFTNGRSNRKTLST